MKALTHLPLVALLALAPSAHAQDTTAEAAPAEAAPGLDMGQQVNEELSYIKETYDDWQLQCFRSEADEDPCQMYQLLREAAGNPVAEFSIFRLPDDAAAAAGATIVVPLGTLLSQGMKISVDDGLAKVYNFSFCSMVGCFARIGFTTDEVEDFKSGENAIIEIVPAQAPNEKVIINASLKGFTAAFDNVSVAPN